MSLKQSIIDHIERLVETRRQLGDEIEELQKLLLNTEPPQWEAYVDQQEEPITKNSDFLTPNKIFIEKDLTRKLESEKVSL